MDFSAMIYGLILALPLTLGIMFVAMIVGFCLAMMAATLRVRRIPMLSLLADVYVSYARSVPVVLQLFVAFYGLPVFFGLFGIADFFTSTLAAIVGLSLYHGGYVSEVVRPAYLAVDKGQHEAADSLGYSFRQKLSGIIGPQAAHIGLPGYGNSIIYLIHNVALVMYIGTADVMATAHMIMEKDYNMYQFSTYLILAVLYSLMCVVTWLVVRFFEHRFARYTQKTAPVKIKLTANI